MTREITTSIDIAAPASAVWAILADQAEHSAWNPFIRLWEGELQVGAKQEVLLDSPNGSHTRFKPVLLVVEPEREIRWRGRLWGIPGLFTGEHSFRIEPLDDASVRFVHGEQFSGLLVAPVLNRVGADTEKGFKAMNEALKRLAEGVGG